MFYDLGNDIFAVDSLYIRPAHSAVFVVRGRGESAIVETAHSRSASVVMEDLPSLGIAPEEIRYICVTHVHLDHAGGAGLYAKHFPNATVVVHPRGERHIIDPTRLVRAAEAVYGRERFYDLHGDVYATPADRVRASTDAEALSFGGRKLICLDTPGHCRHHLSYLLEDDGSIFTGDVFGMTTEGLRTSSHDGIVPTTSPTQFDPDAMRASIDRIVSLAPRRLLLTHFGAVDRVGEAADDLKRMISHHVAIAEDARGDYAAIMRELAPDFEDEAVRQGWRMPLPETSRIWLDALIELNSQGLADWYARTHKED